MHGRRERIRRALSVVVLGCAFVVLVATSGPQDDESERVVEFNPVSFDGRTEVVEGSVVPEGDVASYWGQRVARVAVASQPTQALLLVELLDEAGAVIGSNIGARPVVEAIGSSLCREVDCEAAVDYRIQSLDGKRLTIDVSVGLTFRAGQPDVGPDVPVDATAPEKAARQGAVRAEVVTSATLRAGPRQAVDAVWLAWESERCADNERFRAAVVGGPPPDAQVYHGDLWTLSGDEGSEPLPLDDRGVAVIGQSCDFVQRGRVRHSSWVVLSTRGPAVEAEIMIVGPEDPPPVRVARGRAEPTVVQHLRGADRHEVYHQVDGPERRPDPLPVYLLTLQIPLRAGVVVDHTEFRPELSALGDSARCGFCAGLAIFAPLEAATPTVAPEDVRANAVVYEISVP